MKNVKVNVWYGYGHLEEIEVRRSDQKLYKFMEGDFLRLYLNDIEDMLILVVQNKLFNLKGEVIMHLEAALRKKYKKNQNTLAEYMILSGAENRPPILDKDLYDSWNSRMELYMQNREHERMILESVEHGPLIWPTVKENWVTRTKKYVELSAAEKIQVDCDIKATNIILQGLPADIYSLVNHHRVAKDLWERVQLLIQGISLTKQERECKLYDAFDKFTHIKGESLHNLPPEWSKFVIDVKLVKDLHTTNFDQLHAYLEQHELHANKVRLLCEHNQDPLAFVANQQMTPPHFNTYQSSYNNPQLQQQFPPSQDDPIAFLNKTMAFLIAVASSRVTVQQVHRIQGQSYSSTGYKSNVTSSGGNNASGQARIIKCYKCQSEGHMARQCTQPKRRRNATWYKDKAMLVEAQEARNFLDEEHLAFLADLGNEDLNTYDSDCDDISNAKAVLMANISNYGFDVILEVPYSETYLNDMENESVHVMQDFEQTPVVDFTDNEIHSDSYIISYSQYLQETQQANVQDTNFQVQQDSMILSVIEQMSEQMINHVNNWEKANKEQNNESATTELEGYKERVKNFEQRINMDLSSHEKMIDSKMDDIIKEKLVLKEQVNSLEQNLSKQSKEKECLFQIFNVLKSESKEKEDKYMENKIDLEKKIKELDNILFKVGQSAQTVHMLTKPQAFYDNIHKQALGYQNPFYLKKAQRIKPTLLSDDFGKRFTPQQELSAEQAFWLCMSNPTSKPSNATLVKLEAPKELPKVSLVNESLKKLKFHLARFDNVVKIRTTPDARTEVKGKEIVDIAAQIPSANTIVPGMFKLDLEPLAPRLLQNREAHINYLKYTQEQVDILQGIVKQAKAKQPLDKVLDFTCRTFTIVGNSCPLTRITLANVVPPKKTTSHSVETQKPELKVYSRKPKNVKNVGSSKKAKIVESKNANSKPNHTWGSNAIDIPSSSSLVMTGTVRFANDNITRIMGYGDYQLGNVTILKVYYIEGLGHNLFSVGQFCDADLEVAFQKNTCFIRNLEGVDLLSGSRDTNLYTISLDDMLKTSPICLLSKASKTKSWLWHRRLSHLNFGTLNKLAKDGLARGIPRLKFQKDHLCSACALGKSKKSSHQPKAEDTNQEKLYLLHMDLCGHH
ncbi:retrovirus-related pol polyprotein from transposon TNT 1-94 [Tanacetum coccineum]|uniref:Retrovirus-related pol polyprotein from transposon TNT 1-94 n=1 Tax=Tanacetum coccineum TaxID=301880 RepID=A0ABQ4ZLE9_9ASTR